VRTKYKRSDIIVKQPGLLSPTFRDDVISRFQAVAAKLRIRTRESYFGLLGQALCVIATAV
jgi:hypothetical protein